MALIPRTAYQQSDDKLTINVYDITGVYNSISNPGGFGAPNPLVTDMANCIIDCYAPDPVTLLPSSTILVTIDASSVLPNITGLPFVLDSVAVLGSSQAFTDGIWRFVLREDYIVPDPEQEFSSDNKIPIIASVLCCIQNLILVADSCTCHGKNNYDLLQANMLLDQLFVEDRSTGDISAIEECNLFNKGAEIIINAQAICANRNCSSCNNSKCC